MNSNNSIVLTASAPILMGLSVSDIYLIGMLIIALIGLIPTIYSLIKSIKSGNEEKVKADTKEVQEAVKEVLDNLEEKSNGKE